MLKNTKDEVIIDALKTAGVDFFVSVPCKLLAGVIHVLENTRDVVYVPVTREEEGIGLCAGAFLGGRMPCIFMQNSGLGNSINALASLTLLYRMPLVMMISHRGTPGEKIGAQFPMGQLTPALLENLNIPQYRCDHVGAFSADIPGIVQHAGIMENPVAVLLDFKFWRSDDETI